MSKLLVMNAGLKATHDLLLTMKPEGAAHDESQCPVCQGFVDDHPEGKSMSDKTYTEEELKAAVDKAIADATSSLQARLTELENSQQKSEMDAAVAAAKAEAQAAIDELQSKLDAAVIEATQAKTEKENLEQFFADAAKQAEETAAREARRESRLAQLKDEAHFPEDYLKENEDRFVAMSDEEFTARLEEYKALVLKNGAEQTPPSSTALTAARQTTSTKPGSVLREVLDLRRNGIDPRSVRL